VGPGVQPLQGENYTYSCVLDHGYLLIRFRYFRVVLLDFYLGQLRCEEWMFSHLLDGLEGEDQELRMPGRPESGAGRGYAYIAAHA